MKLKLALQILLILIVAGSLRFINLGYSEFQDDEKKAFIRRIEDQTTTEFLLEQRKGPAQFIVTSTTTALGIDDRNELLVRLPFTIINMIGIVILFLLLKDILKSTAFAIFGTLLFATNGFFVGFARIAQYQNLNIAFSFISLYFFHKLKTAVKPKDIKLYAVLGTAAFCISLLAHWDAIFILVPIIYWFIKFLLNVEVEKTLKKKVVVACFAVGLAILTPFMGPYIYNHTSNESNIKYFNSRVNYPSTYPLERHLFIFELYNPFITLYLIPILGLFAVFSIKDKWIYFVWFGVNFAAIRVFMEKPGTHIYNYVIPALLLAIIGANVIGQYLYKRTRIRYGLFIAILIGVIGLLYVQSYKMFVDNRGHYPWEEKEIFFGLETEKYKDKEVLTFGFPHNHNWKKVAEIIDQDPDNCSYVTNEGKEIAQIYVSTKYGIIEDRTCHFIVKIRKPFISTRTNSSFAKAHGKKPIYEYKKDGETYTELYKVNN